MEDEENRIEYDVLQSATIPNQDNLNEQAAIGWRFVQVIKHEGIFFSYFERRWIGAKVVK